MKKRTFAIVICLLVYGVVSSLVLTAVVRYNLNQIKQELEEEVFDEVDKNMAIEQLSEFRGMILEVESLSHEDIPQGLLLDELENITTSNHFTNKYLDDFAFDIPNTSNVGELCDEFISQIDDQIHTIEYGAKGE